MRRTFRAAGLVIAFAFCLVVAACGSKPDDKPIEQTIEQPTRPGTDAWAHGALKLPSDSPIVLVGRLDRLTRGAGSLKEWLVADPAMFGEFGNEIVAQLDVYWSFAVGFFGGEPNDPAVWKRRGIDPERRFYAGVYPLGPEGEGFLTAADAAVGESLGVRKGETTQERLTHYSKLGPAAIPTGFNGDLQRAVERFAPLSGVRVVVPITESTTFEGTFLSLIDALEFNEVVDAPASRVGARDGARVRVFTNGGDFPVIRLQVDAKHAVIDYVTAPVSVSTAAAGGAEPDATLAALVRAQETFEAGRPAAPAPLDDPALSVTFHQPSVALLARVRGYQRSLTQALKMSASDRDAAVLEGIIRAEKLASNWHDDDLGFSGLTYSLSLHEETSNRIGSLAMTFVGSDDRPELTVRTPKQGLGVEERSVGISLDFNPLFDDAWQAWLGLADPLERLDLLDDAESDPFVFLMTMPRNLALVAANLAEGDPSDAAPGFGELLSSELPNVARAEVAATTPDLTSIATAPQYVGLFVMNSGKAPQDVAITASAARDFVIATTAGLVDVDIDMSSLPELTEGWSTVEIEGLPTHRIQWLPGEEPRLFVAVGMDDAASEAEAAAVEEALPDARDEVVFFHARPTAFVELLSSEASGELTPIGPLDPPILAQRLGPIRGWVKPRKGDDLRAIHFVFELQRPPKL